VRGPFNGALLEEGYRNARSDPLKEEVGTIARSTRAANQSDSQYMNLFTACAESLSHNDFSTSSRQVNQENGTTIGRLQHPLSG
jgi:hypothetical protein